MNNNLKIGGVFCELKKAFNCVDHKILMNKLELYDIEGNQISNRVLLNRWI
jgi:hypothetical protein